VTGHSAIPKTPAAVLALALCLATAASAQSDLPRRRFRPWGSFAQNPQHTAVSPVRSQSLQRILWQTPVDLAPQYSGDELGIHYGSPLITARNTVIVPVKTGDAGGFRVEAHSSLDGSLKWTLPTDYILPPHDWIPEFGPALASGARVYFPGAGGTVYFRDDPDSADGPHGQLAFYGLSSYYANPEAYDARVMIDTPLTADESGNLYFGFQVTGDTPLGLASGIARIGANGEGTWISAATAAGDSSMIGVVQNCAPALSLDSGTLYLAVSDGNRAGYLLALDSVTLARLSRVRLRDPATGDDAQLPDDGTASPMVGWDGDVYFGVFESAAENHDRGWLLHFDRLLGQSKNPGAFGWDDTPSLVPSSMVPSYAGSSTYLLMTKYNNYAEAGGDGLNRIAVLDPNGTETDPVTGATVMREVLTIAGPTPDGSAPAVKEWCINSAAVDPWSRSVIVNSEDGNVYRWDLTANRFSERMALTAGVPEPYTPTAIGPDGTVYSINNGMLFAIGAATMGKAPGLRVR
jgi:hypothetical protein